MSARRKRVRYYTGAESKRRIKSLRRRGYRVEQHRLDDGTVVILRTKRRRKSKRNPWRKKAED